MQMNTKVYIITFMHEYIKTYIKSHKNQRKNLSKKHQGPPKKKKKVDLQLC